MSQQEVNQSIKSVRWNTINNGIQICIRLIVNIYFMKIISPENFGVFAICVVIIQGLRIIIERGVTGAIIERKDIDSDNYKYLLSFNAKVSIAIWGGALLVISFFKGVYFLELAFLFSSLLFYSFTIVPRAVFKKENNFGIIAKIEIFALLISLVVAGALVYKEYFFWALISLYTFNFLVLMILYLLFFKERLYGTMRKVDEKFFDYSRSLGFNNLLVYASKNIDQFLVTGLFGLRFQGIYNRSLTIFAAPSRGLARSVSEVLMTSLSQKDKHQKEAVYYKTLQLFSFFLIPFVFMVYFLLDYLLILVGSDWSEIHFFSLFVLAAIIPMSINTFFGSLLVSSGKKELVYEGMILRLISTLLCLSIGAFFGIIGLLLGKVVAEILIFLINAAHTKRILNISLFKQLFYFKEAIIMTGLMAVLIFINVNNEIGLLLIPLISLLVYTIFDREIFKTIFKIARVVLGIK